MYKLFIKTKKEKKQYLARLFLNKQDTVWSKVHLLKYSANKPTEYWIKLLRRMEVHDVQCKL